MGKDRADAHVVVVGGGFAGVGCAKALAKEGVAVTLIDRLNYHQFQPLLYQVATGQLGATDVARPLRGIFRRHPTVLVKEAEVTAVDPTTRTVTTAEGLTFTGDHLVLACGSQPAFFNTPGAREHTFPLYSVDDAERLRSRVFQVFEDADRDPSLVERGALNFVVVGGGATGVETAGALAELVSDIMPSRFHDLPTATAKVYLVDLGHVVLAPFSDKAHDYAAAALRHRGVDLRLGLSAKEVHADRVVLSDGTVILTRAVVWAGGLKAAPLAGAAGLPQGRGGRIDVADDLTVEGFPGVWVAGDVANIPDRDGTPYPQLGSVALQSGEWVAANILRDLDGKHPERFHYRDKGIMAMIGRNAAVAEMGPHRHELHGPVAFASWLGVHAWLMSGVHSRVDAFVAWGWDYFSHSRPASIVDRDDAARIEWGDDDDTATSTEGAP